MVIMVIIIKIINNQWQQMLKNSGTQITMPIKNKNNTNKKLQEHV